MEPSARSERSVFAQNEKSDVFTRPDMFNAFCRIGRSATIARQYRTSVAVRLSARQDWSKCRSETSNTSDVQEISIH